MFKVGDKVTRIHSDFKDVVKGHTYIVKRVCSSYIELEGCDGRPDPHKFIKTGQLEFDFMK